ncbi:MAG TPA: glycosyl-4,4'-diaponeurosporenoate acyltransferase [Spirochaetia bacterium]|nr:glycosyl-4,4'-diaponeurosporenoate acyltransferase [Spirochaetia bacterium]
MPVMIRLVLISLAWVVLQIGSGFITNKIPRSVFFREGFLFRTRRWEHDGELYERVFRIRSWKESLPEAGGMFKGGFAKRAIGDRSSVRLELFIAETRRAEFTHWLVVVLSFSFFAWNPPHIAAWMPIIGFLGNAPFIMVQRHLRPRMQRLAGGPAKRERPTR